MVVVDFFAFILFAAFASMIWGSLQTVEGDKVKGYKKENDELWLDTELQSNVVDRGDKEGKGDKGDKGEKVLCTNATSYETTVPGKRKPRFPELWEPVIPPKK